MQTTTSAVTGIALTEFVRTNAVGLTRFAYVLCGDRGLAEDLVQETFTALYRRFGPILPIEAPVAYARRALVNRNVSHARLRSTSHSVVGDVPDRAVDAPDGSEQDAMWRVLAALPERQRSVLAMRYYLDLPDREIAAALDCREGTVRSLATRAFAALRDHPAFALPEETS